jgi:hypothetical protein
MEERNNPPANETNEESHPISDFYEGVKDMEKRSYEYAIRKGRTTLFVIAGLLLVSELVGAMAANIPIDATILAIVAVEAGIFVALGFWTKSKPFSAILIGLIVFIGFWIIAIVISGITGAILGILIRAVIVYNLITTLKPAKAWELSRK